MDERQRFSRWSTLSQMIPTLIACKFGVGSDNLRGVSAIGVRADFSKSEGLLLVDGPFENAAPRRRQGSRKPSRKDIPFLASTEERRDDTHERGRRETELMAATATAARHLARLRFWVEV